jgi:hypothetical protein
MHAANHMLRVQVVFSSLAITFLLEIDDQVSLIKSVYYAKRYNHSAYTHRTVAHGHGIILVKTVTLWL